MIALWESRGVTVVKSSLIEVPKTKRVCERSALRLG